jgi:hypothetical protein
LENGKSQKNGRKAFAGCIRHIQALICAQGGLGRLLCTRYNIEGSCFPHPGDKEAWLTEALWPASDPQANLSYQQLLENISSAFEEMGIKSRKVTHAFRVFMAQKMDEAGVDDQVRRDATRRWSASVVVRRAHPDSS